MKKQRFRALFLYALKGAEAILLVSTVVLFLLYQLQTVITVPTWTFVLVWISIALSTVRLIFKIAEIIADSKIKP